MARQPYKEYITNCIVGLMRGSIRNFNIPPTPAHPGHLTVHRARGGGI